MKRIHIVGGKNHGKTTLVVELVRQFGRQGIRVGTIKHTHHHHELDTPGKDSYCHREAGASVVGILSPKMNAIFWSPTENRDASSAEGKYAAFTPMFDSCQLVIVEGDLQTRATKLEVWRREIGSTPLAAADHTIAAVITDDVVSHQLHAEIWPRSDVVQVAQKLLSLSKSHAER